jgi:hypothetical protein
MKIDYHNKKIKCFICNEDKDMTKIYVNYPYEEALSCDRGHIIGHTIDKEWKLLIAPCKYHYLYHCKGQCRCVQEECNCFGIDEECENPLGKRAYLEELND